MSYKTIICLGDSIANGYWDEHGLGWFGRLSEKIALARPGRFGFNNLAMSGDRVTDIRHRLCSEALTRNPDILLIAAGVNDTVRWESPDAPMDISPGLRREVWCDILKTARRNIKTIAVCGLLPVLENKFPQEGVGGKLLYHNNSDIDTYNELLQDLCNEFGVQYVPASRAWQNRDPASLLADATHPNGQGHELIAEFMFDRLDEFEIF